MNQNHSIIYISRALFPNKSANSVHLMKMSQAISRIFHDVTLIGLKEQKNTISKKEIFENYDIIRDFNLKLISIPKRGIWIYLLIYIFFWLNFQSRKNKIIYSREPLIVFLSLILGFKAILESHDFFESKSRRDIEKKIFKHKNFLKLIVISNALKNDYMEYFHNNPRIEVHPDAADIVNENCIKNITWPQ